MRTAQFNRFAIQMTAGQAMAAHHKGACDADVAALLQDEEIKAQLAEISDEDLVDELLENGVWGMKDNLEDRAANEARIIWIAAGHITEELNAEADTDYSTMTDAEFDGILQGLVNENYRTILQIPGIYEILREHWNNEVLSIWAENKQFAAEQGETEPEQDFVDVNEQDLISEYGDWGEYAKYPRSDWAYEVKNNDTSAGYWHWVANRIMNDGR